MVKKTEKYIEEMRKIMKRGYMVHVKQNALYEKILAENEDGYEIWKAVCKAILDETI